MSRDYKNLRNNKKSSSEVKIMSNLFPFSVGLILGAFITSVIFFITTIIFKRLNSHY